MIRTAGAALLLLVFLGNGDDQARAPETRGTVTVHQQIIIRVAPRPRINATRGATAERQSVGWREERGPRCLPARQIVHADQLGQESIDLVLRDNSRVRARLERRCPALDFYFGFYVSPNRDGMICADRDSIRTRAGVTCGIDQFRLLRPREP